MMYLAMLVSSRCGLSSCYEAEDAKWWDSHHELVEDTLLEAIKKGKTKEGMAMKLTRERR
jgi:hypothetical protein